MGFLDGLFGGGGGAKAEQVNVNQDALNAMGKYRSEAADKTPEEFAKENLRNIDTSAKDYSQQTGQREKALGGDEPGISGAIQARYKNIASEGLQKLKNQAELQSYGTKAERLQTAVNMDKAMENIQAENKQRQLQADQANARSRASALSSILGVAGTVAGTAIGGPGVGGKIGGAAGGAVGGMLGSQL